jgi:acetolactate synthase-1/3 small subunit
LSKAGDRASTGSALVSQSNKLPITSILEVLMRHTLIATVENKPGVLNRVASLFRRRNFNIDSLNAGRTEDPNISRMTIVLDSEETDARLVEANLYKLVNVIDIFS